MTIDAGTSPLVTLSKSERDDRVALIRLNRPAQRNAINMEMALALRDAVTALEDDPSVNVAILGGSGPVFCAGMDLAAFAAGERPGLDGEEEGFAFFVRRRRKKPIIAAVQGDAVGGGFELMLACDLAIAVTGARFALPEVKRGIIAAGGGAVRLPSRIPLAVAREILLTGNPIDAGRAYELGLLNAVVAASGELEDKAMALAGSIADNAPLAVAASMALCDVAAVADEADGWAENALQWRKVAASEDAREGAASFKEKRKAVWRGR